MALAAFELIMRQFYNVSTTLEPDYRLIYTPGVPIRAPGEGHAVSNWSAHGVRGSKVERAGEPAVITLGDSYTEAVMVDDHEVFTAVAEEKMQKSGSPLRILNLGISGGSIADYVGYSHRYKTLFNPVWTVVQLRDEDLDFDSSTGRSRTSWRIRRTVHFKQSFPAELVRYPRLERKPNSFSG